MYELLFFISSDQMFHNQKLKKKRNRRDHVQNH